VEHNIEVGCFLPLLHNSLEEEGMEARKRELLRECIACGICLENCPVFPSMKFNHLGTTELIERILKVLEEGLISEEVYDTLWSCMGCAQCRQWCPVDIAPWELFSLARLEMTNRGQKPPPLAYQFVPGPYSLYSILSALQVKPSSVRWLTRAPEDARPVDVVLFLGCYVLALPNIIFTLLDILERMGIDFVVLGGGGLCCGAGYGFVGDIKDVERAAGETLFSIMAFKPKTVVCQCGTCYGRFATRLSQFSDVPLQCQHYPQFLVDNLDKIRFTKSINKVVTYHDHCNLRRAGGGDYEAARKLLQAIPGVTLVEMEHNREDALCCGGLANFTYPDVTRGFRDVRLEEAKAAGAELLVTTCPSCYTAFAGLEEGYPFKVTHDILLLGEAMGINYEDKFKGYLYCDDLDSIIEEARGNIETNNLDPAEVKRLLPLYLEGLRRKSS